jgi:hypothetical protein
MPLLSQATTRAPAGDMPTASQPFGGRMSSSHPSTPPARHSTEQPTEHSQQVGCLIGMNLPGSAASPPRRRQHRWDVAQHGLEYGGVGHVGGGDGRGQRQPAAVADQVDLRPGLATIDRICAHMIPRAWRARSWCPRSPATSPADPPHPTVQDLEMKGIEHASLGPLGQAVPTCRR